MSSLIAKYVDASGVIHERDVRCDDKGYLIALAQSFKLSSYSDFKTATTTVTGQSEAIASGTNSVLVKNMTPVARNGNETWLWGTALHSGSPVTVYDGPCRLGPMHVNVALAGDICTISDGATPGPILRAGVPALGNSITGLVGLSFATSLVFTFGGSVSAGTFLVGYLPVTYGLFGFGTSAVDAESRAAQGMPVLPGETVRFERPANATHKAWIGVGGTVSLYVADCG